MENKELVSIIMPAYNASKYIQESIDSVISQKYLYWELIIIDDGSTDNTLDIIKTNVLRDNRIKVFHQKNGKQGKARNSGLKLAEGDYIAFLDADDLWMPEKLFKQIKEIKEKNVDLLFSDSYIFYENNSANTSQKMRTETGFFFGKKAIMDFIKVNKIPILTVLAKKEKITKVECFSEKEEIQNAEDYHLWLKMLINGSKFYGSKDCFTKYRIHEKSATNEDPLCRKQKIEIFHDLKGENFIYKEAFLDALRNEFRKQLSANTFSKSEFFSFLEKNCSYLEKPYFIKLIKLVYFSFGKRRAQMILNFL